MKNNVEYCTYINNEDLQQHIDNIIKYDSINIFKRIKNYLKHDLFELFKLACKSSSVDIITYLCKITKYRYKIVDGKYVAIEYYKFCITDIDCPICFEQSNIVTICNHHFCSSCIKNIKICPLCRGNIRGDNKCRHYYCHNCLKQNIEKCAICRRNLQ